MNNKKSPYFYITKIESARRQLETAIKMYFYDDDIVSVYALTWNVYNLLSDLIEQEEEQQLINRSLSFIIPEERKEMRELVRKAGNFFKHATKKEEFKKPLKFYYKSLYLYLLDSCRMYQTLTKEITPLMSVYQVWYFSKHPDLILIPSDRAIIDEASKHVSENKLDFLNNVMPIAKEMCKKIFK